MRSGPVQVELRGLAEDETADVVEQRRQRGLLDLEQARGDSELRRRSGSSVALGLAACQCFAADSRGKGMTMTGDRPSPPAYANLGGSPWLRRRYHLLSAVTSTALAFFAALDVLWDGQTGWALALRAAGMVVFGLGATYAWRGYAWWRRNEPAQP